MSKDALENIFGAKEVVTIYGTIVTRISARQYKVQDDKGSIFVATSTQPWGIGAKVIVQNKLIIGTGKRSGTFRTYKV